MSSPEAYPLLSNCSPLPSRLRLTAFHEVDHSQSISLVATLNRSALQPSNDHTGLGQHGAAARLINGLPAPGLKPPCWPFP